MTARSTRSGSPRAVSEIDPGILSPTRGAAWSVGPIVLVRFSVGKRLVRLLPEQAGSRPQRPWGWREERHGEAVAGDDVAEPASYLADRWNRSRAMALTIALWSLCSALGGLVPAGLFGLLLALRGALGFGQAVTDPSGSRLVADFYGLENRGRAFSGQQCLVYVGLALGLAIGTTFGTHFGHLGWRLAFGVSIVPGLGIAYFCYRLPEPRRGTADRGHVTHSRSMELSTASSKSFPIGIRGFLRQMWHGLVADVRTIIAIRTMRYALVGVSAILFVVTSVATWMPTLYQREFHLSQNSSNFAFAGLVIIAGIPGTVIGGRMADRWVRCERDCPTPSRPTYGVRASALSTLPRSCSARRRHLSPPPR